MYSEAGYHREIVKTVPETFISNCFPGTREQELPLTSVLKHRVDECQTAQPHWR